MQVPFLKPPFGPEERDAVARVMETAQISTGAEVVQFEQDFANFIGVEHAMACCSGTAALDLAIEALMWTHRLEPGDRVIIPSFTFAAVAACVVRHGLTPKFVDIDPESYLMQVTNEDIYPGTKAIIVVHTFGRPCNMEEINRIAKEHGMAVIEDCAEACGAKGYGKKLGGHGDIGIFSFNATKNLTTGEGGMVVTGDHGLAHEVKILREHGILTDVQNIRRDVYRDGHNFRMSNILAAIGQVQLKKLRYNNKVRAFNTEWYNDAFESTSLQLPATHPSYAHWVYSLVLHREGVVDRDSIVMWLRDKGIEAKVYFDPPLHKTKIYSERTSLGLPNTETVSRAILQLPLYPQLSVEEIDYVIENVRKIL